MNILHISFSAGLLIILILLIRTFAIHKFPKRMFTILWSIVLIRLLIPISIPIPIGSITPWNTLVETVFIQDVTSTENLLNINNMPLSKLNDFSIFYLIWSIGAIVWFILFLTSYIKSYWKLQESLPLKGNEALDTWQNTHPIIRSINLRESDRIATPITYGIFYPRIVLPRIMDLSDHNQLNYVMTHELIHIKRFDNLWKIISILTLCLHWFNPFVWIMYSLFQQDLEMSCDEKVISLLGESEKEAYAIALINLAVQKESMSLLCNGFGKNGIQERIVAIMKYKKTSYQYLACIIILVLASCIVFFKPAPNTHAAALTYVQDTYDNTMTESDLIFTEGVNGTKGYIKASDFDYKITSTEKALAKNKQKGGHSIPLYLEDGKTIIGEFIISHY